MSECVVCCDKKKLICCKICNKETCKTCIKRYIEESEKEVATCMHCSTFLNKQTLIDMLGITYVKQKYSKLQNNIRISNHHNSISKYQPYAERKILIQKSLDEIYRLTLLLNAEKELLSSFYVKSNKDDEKKVYIKKCTIPDCNGYLNKDWKCGLCDANICKMCHEEIKTDDDNHICNEDLKKTIKLLDKDTRSCPKCNTGIYKIDGCDQLWCTICHTAFSWKTGKIEEGRIHNPHYYSYLRENSADGVIRREENIDDNCNIIIGNNYAINTSRVYKYVFRIIKENEDNKYDFMDDIKYFKKIRKISLLFANMIKHYHHCNHIKEKITIDLERNDINLKDKSVSYLLKKIDKNELDTYICKISKKNEILNEKNLIMDTLNTIMKEKIYAYYNNHIIRIFNVIFFNKNEKKYSNINKSIYEDILVFYKDFYDDFIIMNNEFLRIINYCIEQDRNIQKVNGTTSRLDILPNDIEKFVV